MLGLSVEAGEGPFVEPSSRVQWVDKLIHLIRFSEFMLVLEGIDGVGKTTLLRQLRPDETDSTLKITEITLSANTSTSELLNQIISKLPDHTQQGGDDRARLQYIYSYGQALRNAGQHWVLVVDEAHHLSAPALDVLLNFITANQGGGQPPQLLLSGTPLLGALLSNSHLATTQAARIHRMMLEPLNADDSAAYLQQKFPAVAKHPEKLRQKLIRESSGIPAELDRLAVMLMHTGKVKYGRKIAAAATAGLASPVAAAEDPLAVVSSGGSETLAAPGSQSTTAVGSAKAFPLSGLQMGLVAGVLVAITGVAVWQFMPEQSDETIQLPVTAEGDSRVSMRLNLNVEESAELPTSEQGEMSKARQELEKRLAAYENRTVTSSAPAATALAPPSDQPPLPVNRVITELTPDSQRTEQPVVQAVEPKVVSQSPLPAVQPAPAPVQAVAPPEPVVEQPAPVVVKAKPEPLPKPAPKPVAKSKPVKVAAVAGVRETELLSWPATGYTLQLQGSRAAKSALEFIRQQQDKSNFYYFTTVYKGGPWHVVVYGRYADRKTANAAIKTLPASLQRLKPWARTIRGVQADIRKKN